VKSLWKTEGKKHRTKTKRSPESRQEVVKLSSKFKNTYITFTIFNYLFMRKRKFGWEGENRGKANAKHGKGNRLTEANQADSQEPTKTRLTKIGVSNGVTKIKPSGLTEAN
jgi:hypothetical protein